MSKPSNLKCKKAPWIPPGKHTREKKILSKSHTSKSQVVIAKDPNEKFFDHQKNDLELTYCVEVEDIPSQKSLSASKEPELVLDAGMDELSLSSDSSLNKRTEFSTHFHSIKREMMLMNVYFASLKTSISFLNRFPSFNTDKSSVKDLLLQIEDTIKDFETSYEYLECSLILWENFIDGAEKSLEFSNVIKCKENLLTKLLEAYKNTIIIFQSEVKNQNNPSNANIEECLRKKLYETERRCSSQDSIIKDLERRVSIYQGKSNAMESYKSTLEETRDGLEKQLIQKDIQIKSLNSKLLYLSNQQTTDDHEKLIEIMEELKNQAHAEKTALKKALRLMRTQVQRKEELVKSAQLELKEKEKMLFNIASQRDQLKVELTIANNNVITFKNQLEDIKNQNHKYIEKISEVESASKLELQSLNKKLQENIDVLNSVSNEKMQFERKCEEMTEKLHTFEKEMKNVCETRPENFNEATQEMKNLILLLEETKHLFHKSNLSHHDPNAGGDNCLAEANEPHNSLITVVQESKELLLELKKMYKTFFEEQKQPRNNSDIETKLAEIQNKYDISHKENKSLKAELQAAKAKFENKENLLYSNEENVAFSSNKNGTALGNDTLIRYEYEMKLKDLEYELKETKNKLKKQELQNIKMSSLEEELNAKKQELSILEQKKEQEHERFQQKIKELQESYDAVTQNYECLKKYNQQMKASYFNVFGFS